MHLTFEGRQDGNKSGSRDRPARNAVGLVAPPARLIDPALHWPSSACSASLFIVVKLMRCRRVVEWTVLLLSSSEEWAGGTS